LRPLTGISGISGLKIPGTIFVSRFVPHSKSLRPQYTVGPLVDILGMEKLGLDFSEGKKEQLIAPAKGSEG
jgi:hypothetical protein